MWLRPKCCKHHLLASTVCPVSSVRCQVIIWVQTAEWMFFFLLPPIEGREAVVRSDVFLSHRGRSTRVARWLNRTSLYFLERQIRLQELPFFCVIRQFWALDSVTLDGFKWTELKAVLAVRFYALFRSTSSALNSWIKMHALYFQHFTIIAAFVVCCSEIVDSV